MKHLILGTFVLVGLLGLSGCAAFNQGTLSIASTPVVADGTVYFQGLCEFYAVDAETGSVKWKVENAKPKMEEDEDHYCD